MKEVNSLSNYLHNIPKTFKIKEDYEPNAEIDDCIEKLKRVINKYEINKNNRKISKNKLIICQKEIQDTCEIVYSCLEKNLAYIDHLKQNKIYNYLFKASNCRYTYIQRINSMEIFNLESKVNETTEKLNGTIKALDNIWGNVLSVILSFSMVASLVAGIEKIEKEYLLLFSFIVIWIGMTLLLFFSSLFDNKQLENNTAKCMYKIFTGATIVVIIMTLLYAIVPYSGRDRNNNNNSNSNSISVLQDN